MLRRGATYFNCEKNRRRIKTCLMSVRDTVFLVPMTLFLFCLVCGSCGLSLLFSGVCDCCFELLDHDRDPRRVRENDRVGEEQQQQRSQEIV